MIAWVDREGRLTCICDEELSAPVTSRQLVENLVKENAKLKQHIQNPRKIDELIQVCFTVY